MVADEAVEEAIFVEIAMLIEVEVTILVVVAIEYDNIVALLQLIPLDLSSQQELFCPITSQQENLFWQNVNTSASSPSG